MKNKILLLIGCLCIAIEATELSKDNETLSKDVKTIDKAEKRQDLEFDDNIADSSVSSYSTVVIHHPNSKTRTQWTIDNHQEIQPKQNQIKLTTSKENIADESNPARSESYFRVYRTSTPAYHAIEDSTLRTSTVIHSHDISTRKPLLPTKPLEPKKKNHRHHDVQQTEYTTPIKSQLPPGMTPDLMNQLLNQQPQTFDYGLRTHAVGNKDLYDLNKQKSIIDETFEKTISQAENGSREPRPKTKKYKMSNSETEKSKKRGHKTRISQQQNGHENSPDSFNVGYSIGFGHPNPNQQHTIDHSNDVVFGKPKGSRGSSTHSNLKLHINGENSVWKQIHPSVEMSHETNTKKSPPSYTANTNSHNTFDGSIHPGSHSKHSGHNNFGQSYVYFEGFPHYHNHHIPTGSQDTFDHEHALGQSNPFDLSNAVPPPTHLALKGHIPTTNYDSYHFPKHSENVFAQPKAINPNNFNLYPYQLDFPKMPFLLATGKEDEYSSNTFSNGNLNTQNSKTNNYFNGYDYTQGFAGIGTPVPIQNVFIPGNKIGHGQMIPAIVIPINQLTGFDGFGKLMGSDFHSQNIEDNYNNNVFNVNPPNYQPVNNKPITPTKPHVPRINSSNKYGKNTSGKSSISVHLAKPAIKGNSPSGSDHLIGKDSSKQASSYSSSPIIVAPASKLQPYPEYLQKSLRSFDNSATTFSQRNARLNHLQQELNSILAEEMYRKNNLARPG